jgi:hypothetical protein
MRRGKRKLISRHDNLMMDDSFSRELENQGDDGRWLRYLYLQESMVTYRKRVNDEPLHP